MSVPGRRALVIGSQCRAFPTLSFLPHAAHDLCSALADPAVGACGTADLLIDPTVQELDIAVERAVRAASEAEETLIVALIGHGEYVSDDFYVMARDSTCPANSARAYLLGQRIKEAVREYSMLDGLVVLIDTCHAGIGAAQAAQHWVRVIGTAGRRFEVLTATDDRTAANGCFSRTLASVLRKGGPELGERVRCTDLRQILAECCPHQTAQHLAFDGHRTAGYSDDALWLARNPAKSSLDDLKSTIVTDLIRWYVPTPEFAHLVQLLNEPVRKISIGGPASSGKSALLAAISSSVDATVFPAPGDSADDVARTIGKQLGAPKSVQTLAELLAYLRATAGQRIRIALDLTSVTTEVESHLLTAEHVQVVVAVTDTPLIQLEPARPNELDRYFDKRGVPTREASNLVKIAAGDWVVARALADLACWSEA